MSRRRKAYLPFAVLLVTATTVGFVLESNPTIRAFDGAAIELLRQPGAIAVPRGPSWLLDLALAATWLGDTPALLCLALGTAGYLFFKGEREAALLPLASYGVASLISSTLKAVVGRPRPELVPHLVDVGGSLSFPSGHALLTAATYLVAGAALSGASHEGGLTRRGPLVVAAIIALLAGLSRIYLGVHYPSDVLAGWCIGAAWAELAWSWSARFRRRHVPNGPA